MNATFKGRVEMSGVHTSDFLSVNISNDLLITTFWV